MIRDDRRPVIGLMVLTALAFAAQVAPSAAGEEPALAAFPGAEGFGAVATGGRGGRVIHVTNLNGDGPGSLQAACDADGPRIVVFDVSGVILPANVDKGRRYLSLRHGDLTIAGQTAPGAGITIAGMVSTLRGTTEKPVRNVILRFLRVRPEAAAGGGRNLRGFELDEGERLIVDHCSCCWSIDDLFSFYTASQATCQWNAIEESDIWLEGGDEPHNFGLITGYGGPRPLSIHHSLIANSRERTPAVGSYPTDYRNNVVYNSSSGMGLLVRESYSKPFAMNIVGNTCLPGPGGIIGVRIYRPPYTVANGFLGPYSKGLGHFFLSGNYAPGHGGFVEPWRTQPPAPNVSDAPFAMPPVRTHTAAEAQRLILASAGCLPRDAVGLRTIREVVTGTGGWGRFFPDGGLMEGLTPGKPAPDADGDGMPDAWEKAHGHDPADASDAGRSVPAGASPGDRHKGYTFIEFYVNELADRLVADALTDARLNPVPARPWDRPAKGLSAMASPHKTLDAMVAAIRDQDARRQDSKDVKVKYDTLPAWFAVEQLSRLGAEARPAIPALVELLKSGDARQAAFAAWGLGAMGPAAAEAVPALTAALEKDWGATHGKWTFCPVPFAAWALGRIGAPAEVSAVPAIGRTLKGGQHVWAAEPLLYALRQAGPAAASEMPELLAHIDDAHAAEALANIGEPAVGGLVKVLADLRAPRRIGAIRALGLLGPKAAGAATAVLKQITDADPLVRSHAAAALAAMDPQSGLVATALIGALRDKDMNCRYQAAVALGRCQAAGGQIVAALGESLLSDPAAEVREAAADSLAQLGGPAREALAKGLQSKDSPDTRARAARALGKLGVAAVEPLTAALADADPTVRREAAWSLAEVGPPAAKAAAALKQRQSDDDYVVRAAVEAALHRIGG